MSRSQEKLTSIVHGSELSLASADQDERRSSTICGLRRKVVLAITLAVLLCLGLAVGVGLGVRSKSSSPSTTSPSPQSADSSTSSSSFVRTSTAMTSTSSTSLPKASGTASTSCPATNGTTYQSSGHTYLILCENDIQSPAKVDLGRVYQPTFSACIDTCATLAGDKRADISAVYWVDYDSYDRGTCWCFGGTGKADGAVPSYWSANNLAWIQS